MKVDNVLQLKRAFDLVWESAPGWTMAGAVLVAIQGILPLAALYLMKLIVDNVTIGVEAPDSDAFGKILVLIALAGGVALLTATGRSVSAVVSEAQSALVSDHVQELLHSKSVEVDLEYYENTDYYESLHRAQKEAPFRPTRIVNGLLKVGQSSISLVAVVGLLISLSWIIAAVLLIAALPAGIVRLKYADKFYKWQISCTAKERVAWYHHQLLTDNNHAKEVRIFGLGPLFIQRYRNLRHQLRGERLGLVMRRSASDLACQAISVLAVFGSFAYIAYQTLQGNITLGDLVMYFGAFQQGQNFLNTFLTGMAGLYEDSLFLTYLNQFLELEPKVKESSKPKSIHRPMSMGITFDNVRFGYPNTNVKVLEEISFIIRTGQIVALVGENGSGKTTLIKLLCRLYDPQNGAISWDGTDIREFRISELRREVSVIFQDYARYDMTAWENIWLGNIDLEPDMDEIIKAAEISGANEAITRLDCGYDTVLGRRFENGAELSMGEWQKVALSRAFIRKSQIVVLDEPTSSLDPKAEDDVFRHFRQLVKGRIGIIISHRLSAARMADEIFFLKDGRIVESGTHEGLMDRGGEYARLFEIQAGHYR